MLKHKWKLLKQWLVYSTSLFCTFELMQKPASLRTVNVTRYITPLREGGSLPALAEADDDFKYVLKFKGNGHGPKALIAEHSAGNLEYLFLKLTGKKLRD